MDSRDKLWELERLKASKLKTSGSSVIFHLILVILTAGLWLPVMGFYFGVRAMKNESIEKKIRKLIKEKCNE